MDIDVIGISETSQEEGQNFKGNVNIEGYKPPFCMGSKTARGGVALYAKEDLDTWERDDLDTANQFYEGIWIEIENKKCKNIIVGCLYRHPSSDINDFELYLSKCLTMITKEKKECYIMGDLNVDLLKYETSNKHRDFINNMTSFGYLPYINQPTRITESTVSIIDNLYGNNFSQNSSGGNILIQFADHLAQFVSIDKEVCRLKRYGKF